MLIGCSGARKYPSAPPRYNFNPRLDVSGTVTRGWLRSRAEYLSSGVIKVGFWWMLVQQWDFPQVSSPAIRGGRCLVPPVARNLLNPCSWSNINAQPPPAQQRGAFLTIVFRGRGGKGARQIALKLTHSSLPGVWTAMIIFFNGSPLRHREANVPYSQLMAHL